MDVQLIGLPELLKAFRDLPAELTKNPNAARNPINRALVSALLPMRQAAIALAPAGETGRLKKNIVRGKVKKKEEMFEAGVWVRTKGKGKVDSPQNAWYWFYLEFGTSRQAQQAFLRPAFDQTVNQVVGLFQAKLAESIEKAATRIGKRGDRAIARLRSA